MRKGTVMAGVLALAVAGPAPVALAQDPVVPDANLEQSIMPLDTSGSVHQIDVSAAVGPMEEEKSDGATVTVRISSDVLFDFNKSTLTEVARREIGEIATRLRVGARAVRVSGHSDGIGLPAYNLTLSRQRADAVKIELQRQLSGAGVDIRSAGYGESGPVAPNKIGEKDNPDGRAKNRRVEIAFQKS